MSTPLRAVRAMLIANQSLVALVPPSRVVAGEIPQDTAWPVLLLVHASTQRHGNQALPAGQELLETSIEVIPLAKGYAELDTLVSLIEGSCHGNRGSFDGVSVQQCLRVGIGRDEFYDEQGLWSRPVVLSLIYLRT